MDSDSRLNVTGKGNVRGAISGKGYDADMGASYAGQGGSQDDSRDLTYGTFDQIPDSSYLNSNQMGSGGGSEDKRGGGVIILITKTGTIAGELVANGAPFSTQVTKEYHAGSGGYIYVKCTDSPCTINNLIQANGGYGSDDKKSNAGSGGRIVFDKVDVNDLS